MSGCIAGFLFDTKVTLDINLALCSSVCIGHLLDNLLAAARLLQIQQQAAVARVVEVRIH